MGPELLCLIYLGISSFEVPSLDTDFISETLVPQLSKPVKIRSNMV